jgi:hypothetical protein
MGKETLEEAAERLAKHFNIDFINGAKWQQEIDQEEIQLLKEELAYEKRQNGRENR